MALSQLLTLIALCTAHAGIGHSLLQFDAPSYTITVPETPAGDSDVPSTPSTPAAGTEVRATCSSDDDSLVRYSVARGSIVGATPGTGGVFSVTSSLDYETQSQYSIRLLCYLDSDPSINATATLIVDVSPINEYLPVIMSAGGPTTTTISETTPAGTAIAAVDSSIGPLLAYTASDRDNGQDGVIVYSLVDDLHDEIFTLDEMTGTLLLKAAPDIDALTTPYQRYDVRIAACNEHISVPDCNTVTLMVFVTAANDIAPQYEPPLYPVFLLESVPIGSLVVNPQCVDRDSGPGSSVTTSFNNETSKTVLETFLLQPAGAVLLQAELDYERGPVNFQFQLVCSDGENEAVGQVLVAVLPVNDNSPRFLQEEYEFSVDRSSPTGHTVGQVQAEDDDIDTGSNVTYSIHDSSYFYIDSASGEIRLQEDIPSSASSRFQLVVLATDGDFSTNASVVVSVRGAVSLPEFAGIISGVLIFIVLVVSTLSLIGICACLYIRATRRSAYEVERPTLSADITPSQKAVRFADDEFSQYFPSALVVTNQSTETLGGNPSSSGSAQSGEEETTLSPAPENVQPEETSFTTIPSADV